MGLMVRLYKNRPVCDKLWSDKMSLPFRSLIKPTGTVRKRSNIMVFDVV